MLNVIKIDVFQDGNKVHMYQIFYNTITSKIHAFNNQTKIVLVDNNMWVLLWLLDFSLLDLFAVYRI